MSNKPIPLGSLTAVERLLLRSKAARMGAQEARKTVAHLATLPDDDRVATRECAQLQSEVARQLEQQEDNFEAAAVELVRQMPPADAQPYLGHKHPAIRVAAFGAVCAADCVKG